MLLHFNVPLYRFFEKEQYANDMLLRGAVRLNTVRAFNSLENPQYKDIDEGGHFFKQDGSKGWTKVGNWDGPGPEIISSVTIRKRRIPDAWAFCGTCSTVSKAQKKYAVRIDRIFDFMRQLDYAMEQKFGEKLPIFFGPVSYYDLQADMFSSQEQPVYFAKQCKYKDDHEFRIVVLPPPPMIDNLQPETFILPEPSKVFSKPLILPLNKVKDDNN
jgi:hypothetical protein